MIEVVPNETPEKPEITDKLAMSAIKVIMDYCEKHDCEKCGIVDACDYHFCGMPRGWEIQPQTKGEPGTISPGKMKRTILSMWKRYLSFV